MAVSVLLGLVAQFGTVVRKGFHSETHTIMPVYNGQEHYAMRKRASCVSDRSVSFNDPVFDTTGAP